MCHGKALKFSTYIFSSCIQQLNFVSLKRFCRLKLEICTGQAIKMFASRSARFAFLVVGLSDRPHFLYYNAAATILHIFSLATKGATKINFFIGRSIDKKPCIYKFYNLKCYHIGLARE